MMAKVGRPKLSRSWFCFGAELLQLKWSHAALLGTVAVRKHYELTVSLDKDAHSKCGSLAAGGKYWELRGVSIKKQEQAVGLDYSHFGSLSTH